MPRPRRALRQVLDDLAQLNEGATGPRRKQLERKLGAHLEMLQADMRGEEALPEGCAPRSRPLPPRLPTACGR